MQMKGVVENDTAMCLCTKPKKYSRIYLLVSRLIYLRVLRKCILITLSKKNSLQQNADLWKIQYGHSRLILFIKMTFKLIHYTQTCLDEKLI